MEPSKELKGKYIKQIRLKFHHDFAPYKFMNPYKLLAALNEAIKKNIDMQFVSVRYVMTKNKHQKALYEATASEKEFNINKEVNNIFSLEANEVNKNFMAEFILKDAIELKPPTDFSPELIEKQMEMEREKEEMKKLYQLKEAGQTIMHICLGTKKIQSLRAIESFTMAHSKDQYANAEYEIYAKAIMNSAVQEKLQAQKNEKKPVQIKRKQGGTLKIYFHPTPLAAEDYSQEMKECRISEWGLCTKVGDLFCTYFGTAQMNKKSEAINKSIKFRNSISLHEINDVLHGINLTSSLWNQILLRINIQINQIKKIQYAEEIVKETRVQQYYFYLTRPPRYFISILKKDEAFSQKYIKNWERVENFVFLNNKQVKDNYMMRFYLFNNTFVKITLIDNASEGYSINEAYEKIQEVIKKIKNPIKVEKLDKLYDAKFNQFKSLYSCFQYNKVLKDMSFVEEKTEHLIWQIKYLILVMVRFNYLFPQQVSDLLQFMKEHYHDKQNCECFLFILWKTAISMWGYNQKERYIDFFKKQYEEMKALQQKNILKRLGLNTKLIAYVFRLSLTPSGYLFDPPTPQMKGRLLKEYSNEVELFLRVSIQEESQTELKNQKYITKMIFRKEMDEINILGRKYIPLGWSPSQLRSSSLWYISELNENRGPFQKLTRFIILSFLGDFDAIQNPAKRAARIGQSFSASWSFNGKKIIDKEINDEYSPSGHEYTDGIGKIAQNLIEQISLKLALRQLSVIQIRYKGAKGLLVKNKALKHDEIHLRKSMIKYQCKHENTSKYLDILDWNKYKAGFLNRQIIILLRTLGIKDSIFQQLQNEHIKKIKSMTFKDCSIFRNMTDDMHTQINDLQPANKTILNLVKAGFELQKQPFFRGVLQTMKSNGYHQLKIKSSIRVDKSARIIGIIDEYSLLKENEVYCSIYDPFDEQAIKNYHYQEHNDSSGYVVNGPAIITRNPCLDPADIRKVNCIGKEEITKRFKEKNYENQSHYESNPFEGFLNVVIFPMDGRFPLTAQISGSDLDGDNFFICWDDRLIPKKVYEPNLIDETPKNISEKDKGQKKYDVSYEKMLNFFIDYVNYEKLGQIDNSHLIKADRDHNNFANNKDCKQLAKIHGKAVDFPKTGYCPPVPPELLSSEYPTFMEKQNAKSVYESTSILGILYEEIRKQIQSLYEEQVVKSVTEIDIDLVAGIEENKYQIEDVRKCIKILIQYERELTNVLNMINVKSEYEVYSGNFSTVKDKVKAFGKNRLISSILSLREKFFELFFQDFNDEKRKYEKDRQEEHLKVSKYFSSQINQKAQLFYLISYIYKFPSLKFQSEHLIKLKNQVTWMLDSLKILNKEGKFCGFVWFVIPKIIINMKITQRNKQKKDQDSEEQKVNGDQGYDEGELE